MNVHLFRIKDRPYGFRVVAVVATERRLAMEVVCEKYGAQMSNPFDGNYADLMDMCSATDGSAATFTFEE